MRRPWLGRAPNEMAKPWVWRSANGQCFRPAEMETQHLFNTLRMIWNHVAPDSLRLHPFRAYSSIYPDEYLLEAVRHLAAELSGRHNLTPRQARELDHMIKAAQQGRLTDGAS